jgi:hypothetical protein
MPFGKEGRHRLLRDLLHQRNKPGAAGTSSFFTVRKMKPASSAIS